MEKIISIIGIEQKPKKDGKPYWKVSTNAGNYNCFEAHVIVPIKSAYATEKACKVDIVEKNGYFHIDKFIEIVEGAVPAETIKPEEFGTAKGTAKGTANGTAKNTTMYTSYAKDIFVAVTTEGSSRTHEQDMELAVKLVKQARDAFS